MTSPSPSNIHDAFFKRLMSEPETAGIFLRERLPADVAALLSADPPELLPGSFVDEELAQHHSDLLYRTYLKETGGEALVYVLVEHKSAPDPLVGLQVLRYITRIWDDWVKQGHGRPLPPVIPLVVYHGPRPWTVSPAFADLLGVVPAPLHPYLPAFTYALADLGRIDDEALSHHLRLRAFLKALKYVLRSDLPQRIDVVLADVSALDILDVVLVLTYIDRGPVAVTVDDIRAALRRVAPNREEEIMGGITQPFFDEGVKQGLAQGLVQGEARGEARGEAKGKADALGRLLSRRFGPLPATVRQRLDTATVSDLDGWLDAAIDAPSLDTVFGANSSH